MASLYVVFYFVPALVILFVAAVILFFCYRKCVKERTAEVEVRQDPNNFVVPAGVPDWATTPALLCHHYYMQSMYSLVRETACRYFPSTRQNGPTEFFELGIV